MGKHIYYCVNCGEEIRPEQAAEKTMVALSYAALDGIPESTVERTPVYITRKELENLIDRTDSQGEQYLTLLEYLQFAYNKRNRRDLNEGKAKDAETALQMYHERKAEFEARIAQMDPDAEDEDDELEIGPVIPGFTEVATAQIMKNFPNDICHLEWSIHKTNGYVYCLSEKDIGRTRITPCWKCTQCGEEILSNAFEYRHILVGFFGFPNSAKTCLMAALCHFSMKHGGILMLSERDDREVHNLLADYRGGYTLCLTRLDLLNTFHPSVLKDGILWTFVDVPGSLFSRSQGMDVDRLVSEPKSRILMKCHTYILTVDQEEASDLFKMNKFLNMFEYYKRVAENWASTREGIPIVFALTKVDEVEPKENKRNLPHGYSFKYYPKRYREELSILRNKGLDQMIDALSANHYLFPLSCAPYGFSPLPCDNPSQGYFPEKDQKEAWIQNYIKENPQVDEYMIPHPIWRPANPRNVDLIWDWLEKLFGAKEIVCGPGKRERRDLSTVRIDEEHNEDTLVRLIASIFCNPSKSDLKSINNTYDFISLLSGSINRNSCNYL